MTSKPDFTNPNLQDIISRHTQNPISLPLAAQYDDDTYVLPDMVRKSGGGGGTFRPPSIIPIAPVLPKKQKSTLSPPNIVPVPKGVTPMSNGITNGIAIPGLTGIIPGFGFGNIMTQSGLGLNIPTGALAYGAYNIIARRRRRSILNWILVAYGLYGTGIIGSLTGENEGLGSMALKTAAFAVNPTIGAAAVGGLPMALAALAGAWLSGRGRRRRRTYGYRPRRRRYYGYRRRRY